MFESCCECLVKQFAMCLDVVAILLLNVMEVFRVAKYNLNKNIVGDIHFPYTVHIHTISLHALFGTCDTNIHP